MKLPIGIEFFKDIRTRGYYYVDKTGFIKDLLDSCGSVNLFTRPRRFGKSLNMDMLKTFFEIGTEPSLFDGLCISKESAICKQYMGKYPVISISLKDVEGMDFQTAYGMLGVIVSEEAGRLEFLLESAKLTPVDKKKLNRLIEGDFEKAFYLYSSLKLLTQLLYKHYGIPAIVLIDEYDVPLDKAYQNGYYTEMVGLIRSLFSQVLKTNMNLYFAVITGCLRIARESIFTGLNNFKVRTISDIRYAEYFGFTQYEIDSFLEDYCIIQKRDEAKSWYDGYLFGNTEIYNPWSLINYIYDIAQKNTEFPKPYWSNTASNSIVRELIENADDNIKQEIEELIAGGTIKKPVQEDITYEDIYKSQDNLWNFLFFTGYLKTVDKSFRERQIYLSMTIPNEEIIYIYETTIREWSLQCIEKQDLSGLVQALEEGNCEMASDIITKQLMDTISFYDYKEDYYHGFIAGLLRHNNRYITKSNRESGTGRYDLTLKTKRIRKGRAIILEFKLADNIHGLEKGCMDALEQIEKFHYDNDLIKEGYTEISKYGICFYKKECLVMKK